MHVREETLLAPVRRYALRFGVWRGADLPPDVVPLLEVGCRSWLYAGVKQETREMVRVGPAA